MIETISIDKIQPAADNVRVDLGDLTGMVASMKSVGVLTPLRVKPAKNGGYMVIAGHRRLESAKQAGVVELDCVVEDVDETRRLAQMIVENFHRLDLRPLEEAYAFQRIIDERKLSQRDAAELIGCNQSHISKRLALLKLPARVQKMVEAGTVTVRDAEQLVRLSGHPKLLDKALELGKQWEDMTAAIDDQVEILEVEEKKAAAKTALDAAGITIVKAPGYWAMNSNPRPLAGQKREDVGNAEYYALVGVGVAKHKNQPCHAAVIDDQGRSVFVCTNPGSHAPKAAKAGETETAEDKKRKAEAAAKRAMNKELRAAADERTQLVTTLTGKKVNRNDVGDLVAKIVVGDVAYAAAKRACELLAITADAEAKATYGNCPYQRTVQEFAGRGADELHRAAAAIVCAERENNLTSEWHGWGESDKAYLAFLEKNGHTLSPAECKKLSLKAGSTLTKASA